MRTVVELLYSDSKVYAFVNSACEFESTRILLGKKLSDSNTRFSITRSISASWYSIRGMGTYRTREIALGRTTSTIISYKLRGSTEITPDVRATFKNGEIFKDFLAREDHAAISTIISDGVEQCFKFITDLIDGVFVLIVISRELFASIIKFMGFVIGGIRHDESFLLQRALNKAIEIMEIFFQCIITFNFVQKRLKRRNYSLQVMSTSKIG